MLSIGSASAELNEPYWLSKGVISGESLAGHPVISCYKYVDGNDYVVFRNYTLVQPGYDQDLFKVFLVKDSLDNKYLAFDSGVSFLSMYTGDCSKKIVPCGEKFIREKIIASDEDIFRLIEQLSRTTRILVNRANNENSTLFRQVHDDEMNPKSDSYIVLYKI